MRGHGSQWISNKMNNRHCNWKKSKSWETNIYLIWNPLRLMRAHLWHLIFYLCSVIICIAIALDYCCLIFEFWFLVFYPWFWCDGILILDKDKNRITFFFWNYNTEEVATNFAQSGILLHCNARVAYFSITVLSSTMLSSIINSPKMWEKRLRFFVMTRVKHRAMHLPTT